MPSPEHLDLTVPVATDPWPMRRILSAVGGGVAAGAVGIGGLVVTGAVTGHVDGGLVGSISTAIGVLVGAFLPFRREGEEERANDAPAPPVAA